MGSPGVWLCFGRHGRSTRSPAASRPFSLRGLAADARQAVRALRMSPSITIAALVVLTCGIGATTAIFSVVDAVVLRSLPFEEPDRIVAVGERRNTKAIDGGKLGTPMPFGGLPGFGGTDPEALLSVQPQNYLDWARDQKVFESMAAIANADSTLVAAVTEPEAVALQRVTAGFFDVLRVRPARGHAFTAEEEVDGRSRVAILSDAFWRRRFNADPTVVGMPISLDGDPYEVIGVMPLGFAYPVGSRNPTDLWAPVVVPANERVRGRSHSIYLQSIARLRAGISLDQARARMADIATDLERVNPDWNRGTGAGVRPLRDHMVGANVRSWMLMLLSAVGLVLIIACANVASLLLARAATREREVAVRAALGASRWRLVRQFMVESFLLSVCGAALAVLLAWWAVAGLRSAMPDDVPRVAMVSLHWRVLLAAFGLALATGLLCGVLPALRSSRPNLLDAMNQGSRAASAGRTRQRLRHLLVVSEIALALLLVVGATLFVGSFIRVLRIDPGFSPDHLLTMQIYQRPVPGQPPPDLSAKFGEVVERLGHAPGVRFVAAASPGIPLRPNFSFNDFQVAGVEPPVDRGVSVKRVTADYHKALGIPLRRGRLFAAVDGAGSPPVAIISELTARRYFRDADPIGRTATVEGVQLTVIGVVGDARQGRLEAPPVAEVYLPFGQGHAHSAYFVVRTVGDPHEILPVAKTAVLGVLPAMALRYVATMQELVSSQTAQRRVTMLMLGLFGVLGLVIAAAGVYGAMAYLVAQRTREIGVRMALGATRGRVIALVIGRAIVLVMLGIAIGGVSSWYLASTVKSFLFGLEPNNAGALIGAGVALSVAALVASVVPARRAATVDPTVALRSE